MGPESNRALRMMLLFLSLLLLGAAVQPAPQGQSDCVYVDEDVCSTVEQEVCEDGLEWECEIKTRIEHEGKDVEVCDPTSKTVCVPKTRYEPEEYFDDECTTTTEEVCKTNYETKAGKFNAYNVCQKVLKPRCHTGPTRKTRSGCE